MAAKKKSKKTKAPKTAKKAAPKKSAAKAKAPAKAASKKASKKKVTAKAGAKKSPTRAKTSASKSAGGKKAASKKAAPKKASKKAAAPKATAAKSAKVSPKKAASKVSGKKSAAPKSPAPKKSKASKETEVQKPAKQEIEKVLTVKVEAEPEVVESEVILTDSEGNRYCRVKDCDQLATVEAYCRYHYLLFWKKIQIRKKILSEGRLEKYIEELTARYPDKYLDMLRKDLRSEKEFLAAIQELEIDDNADDNMDEEDSQSFIEEVRGVSEASGRRSDDDY
ncbi:MAG TPA: hypothetical protein DCL41_02135 [Bdellovibrionales bacterium]|nr:hypothetical protein [Pseudobdellovibrionaceae bacterium]HAG90639.1 hypothetical protein [Bdellovibrionales bacterium]|tara:strand:- start:752 stop:1591 length:840 start_codon:yes stop_codon:yes gene_type:complete